MQIAYRPSYAPMKVLFDFSCVNLEALTHVSPHHTGKIFFFPVSYSMLPKFFYVLMGISRATRSSSR